MDFTNELSGPWQPIVVHLREIHFNLNCYGTQKNAVLLMHGAEVKDISGSYHTTWQIVSTNLLVNNAHQIKEHI